MGSFFGMWTLDVKENGVKSFLEITFYSWSVAIFHFMGRSASERCRLVFHGKLTRDEPSFCLVCMHTDFNLR